MYVEKQRVEGSVVLHVEGIIKLGESARFLTEALDKLLHDDQGHVFLELSKINTIDSTGIGELVGYLARFQQRDRKLVLVNPSERIRKLLRVAQLDSLFPIHPSVEAALAAEK